MKHIDSRQHQLLRRENGFKIYFIISVSFPYFNLKRAAHFGRDPGKSCTKIAIQRKHLEGTRTKSERYTAKKDYYIDINILSYGDNFSILPYFEKIKIVTREKLQKRCTPSPTRP